MYSGIPHFTITSYSLLEGRRQGNSEGFEGERSIDCTINYHTFIPLLLEVGDLVMLLPHRLQPQTQIRNTTYLSRHPRLVHTRPANR